jgi:CheY-like chemotaxis protein
MSSDQQQPGARGDESLISSEEFAQKHLIRVRDVKRALKRQKIGILRDKIRYFKESEMVELLGDKLSRISEQRSRALSRTVLVVDDDEANLDLVERTLHGHCTVHRAPTGAAALEILRKEPVEVIIADQRMPQMTGTEFLAEATKIRPDCIRILLSAYTDSSALTSAINTAKVHCFLSKPIAPDALLSKLGEAFAEYQRVKHVQAILVGE